MTHEWFMFPSHPPSETGQYVAMVEGIEEFHVFWNEGVKEFQDAVLCVPVSNVLKWRRMTVREKTISDVVGALLVYSVDHGPITPELVSGWFWDNAKFCRDVNLEDEPVNV